MNKKVLIGISAAATLLLSGGASAFAWWHFRSAPAPRPAEVQLQVDTAKYIGIDQIVVMLKRSDDDSSSRFGVVSLMLTAPPEQEDQAREQVLRVRAVAVETLSRHSYAEACEMSIDTLNKELNDALKQRYAQEKLVQPFSVATVTKYLVD